MGIYDYYKIKVNGRPDELIIYRLMILTRVKNYSFPYVKYTHTNYTITNNK